MGGVSRACGQWVVVRFLFFLVKKKKNLFQMISSVEYLYIKKENLLESSAADNAVASSGLYFLFLTVVLFPVFEAGGK